MKNYRSTLALVLTVVLAICLFALPVMAATESAEGLELTLNTDKAEYSANEKITASLVIKNTSEAAIDNLIACHKIPKDFSLISGTAEMLIETLPAGETVTMNVVLASKAAANTGDYAIVAVAATLALSAAGLVWLGKDAKIRNGIISMFLCCVMVAGLTISVSANALSDGITVNTTVKVDGKDVTLNAVVNQVEPGVYGQVIIADTANGKVTADKIIYKIGETVNLTVNPAEGYAQKLTINGEPLLLDWETDTYSIVTSEAKYVVAGGFEEDLGWFAADAEAPYRFDFANQAHGVISTYYPSDNESWWADVMGEYKAISVKAKNYLPLEDSKDGDGKTGYSMVLRISLSNGKFYAFRIINDKGTYASDRFGASGSATGWGGWKALDGTAAAAMNGDGVDFKLERTGADTLTISVNGTVMATYTMEGVTENDKVVSVGVRHYGNTGKYVEIPFTLSKPGESSEPVEPSDPVVPEEPKNVTLNIADLTNGIVTADKESYKIGDTITLTVTPAEGYAQKLFINGKPLLLDWKTNTYSFIAEEEIYNITGSFEPSLDISPSDAGRWDSSNHAHGILNAYYPVNNDAWFIDIKGEYASITVKAKNYWSVEDSKDGINGSVGYATILRVTLDNGKNYAFRVYNDKGTYAFAWYGGGGSATGWGGWKNIHDAYAADFNGDGVDFKLERTAGDVLTLSINGTVVGTYTMSGVTAANKVVSVGIQHNGNKGEKIEIPFVLEEAKEPDNSVAINIADLTNGTVTADKESYEIGDTVTLTIAPSAGYFQKLYINGEPLMLGWKTFTYQFVATEKIYEITGSFEKGLNLAPSDWGRWDDHNQLHGVLNTYYPNDNDSWWMDIKGEYKSITVKTKNYWSVEDSKDGINGSVGYATILRVALDNGKIYAFRVYNDKGTYAFAWYGNGGSATGWGGWKNIHDAYAADFNGDGVDFKLERTAGDVLTLSINGTVVGTYTMSGVTAANKVVSVGIQHNGNKGEKIEIPFELG